MNRADTLVGYLILGWTGLLVLLANLRAALPEWLAPLPVVVGLLALVGLAATLRQLWRRG